LLKRKKLLILMICLCGIVSGAVASSFVQRRVYSTGRVFVSTLGVEVFWDAFCTNNVTEIAWGELMPGETASKTMFVKNTGNTDVTLSLTTASWNPPNVAVYIGVTWDAESANLVAGGVREVLLTLSVSPDITETTDFSLEIIITGTDPWA